MEFKPNIYPVMYWALAYGVIAGAILFVVFLLSNYIAVIWFPVFLVGVIYGGFRNYKKQRKEFAQSQGQSLGKKPVMQEFREAVADIAVASQEMMAEQQATTPEEQVQTEETPTDESNTPPNPPAPQPPQAPPAPPTPPAV